MAVDLAHDWMDASTGLRCQGRDRSDDSLRIAVALLRQISSSHSRVHPDSEPKCEPRPHRYGTRTRRRNLPPITQRSQRHFCVFVHTPHEAGHVAKEPRSMRCLVFSLTFARIHESNRVRSGVLVDPPIVQEATTSEKTTDQRARFSPPSRPTMRSLASTRNPMDVTSTLRALTRSAKSSRAGARRPSALDAIRNERIRINITLRRRADLHVARDCLGADRDGVLGRAPRRSVERHRRGESTGDRRRVDVHFQSARHGDRHVARNRPHRDVRGDPPPTNARCPRRCESS